MTDRHIEYLALDALTPAPRNPKLHDDAGIDASLERFGFTEAPMMDERTSRLVVGHGRWERLKARRADGGEVPDGIKVGDDGQWLIPVQRGWSSADDAEAEAYLIASNELTAAGGWREHDLAPMLTRLAETRRGLEGTGFDRPQLDSMLARLQAAREQQHGPDRTTDQAPEPPPDPITQRGDLWVIGGHRLLCGSSRDASDVAKLLGADPVNLAVTSPPYADRRDYDPESGFEPIHPDAYVEWFEPVALAVRDHLAADGSWCVNIKAGSNDLDRELYVLDLVLAHARQWGFHLAEEFCWERVGVPLSPRRRLKNGWESVFQFALGEWKWRPDAVRRLSEHVPIPLGKGAGDTSWSPKNPVAMANDKAQGTPGYEWFRDRNEPGLAYPSNRLPTFSGSHVALGHGAAYPVGLPEFFVKLLTDEGDRVFDPFSGSGSTILAAHAQKRIGLGIEISRSYCDVALARIERTTGIVPTRDGEPVSFAHLVAA